MNKMAITIVGATGLVGRTLCTVLTEEKIDADYILFNTNGGAEIEICGKVYVTKALTPETAKATKADFVFITAEKEISTEYAPLFASMGSVVIDNSSAFRRQPDIPLVIPECNQKTVKHIKKPGGKSGHTGAIIANPNCSTIGALVPLKPLDDVYGLERVVYSTYQAVSGAGNNPKFAYPIENNLIPFIFDEEEKMVFETQKILGHAVAISATCVRVPVANCHTVSINAEFRKPVKIEKVKKILAKAKGVVLLADGELPMPITANGKNQVFVGRVRIDESRPNTINMITVSDNVRKGAAVNAVQIFKSIAKVKPNV